MTSAPRPHARHALHRKIELDAYAFSQYLTLPSERWSQLRREEARGACEEWLESAAGDAHLIGQMFADAFLVNIYHWVETSLKLVLSWAPGWTPERANKRTGFEKLQEAFASVSVDLKSLPHANDIFQLLRQFANSWKHNPLQASAGLRSELGLADDTDEFSEYGLFESSAIRSAIMARLDISTGDDIIHQIQAECLKRASEFLNAVVDSTQIRARD